MLNHANFIRFPVQCVKIHIKKRERDPEKAMRKRYWTYAGSTIRQAYIALGAVFKAAKENGLIEKHPMDGVRFDSPVKAVDEITTLSNLISADTRRSRFRKSRGAYFLKISHFDTCVLT